MFYKEMFRVCSNGGMPNLKLTSALMNVHAKEAIYHSRESSLIWAPAAGGKIRMVAHSWRELAMYEQKLEMCFRKAWGLQAKNRLGHIVNTSEEHYLFICRP